MRAAGRIRRRGLWPRESRFPFVERHRHPLGCPAADCSAAGNGRRIWRFGGRVTGALVSRSTVSSPSSAFHPEYGEEDNVRFSAPRGSGRRMPARDARGLRKDCAARRECPSLSWWNCWSFGRCGNAVALFGRKTLRLGFDERRVGRVMIGRWQAWRVTRRVGYINLRPSFSTNGINPDE